MGELQATWNNRGELFAWSSSGDVKAAIAEDYPTLKADLGRSSSEKLVALATGSYPNRRKEFKGRAYPISDGLLSVLADISPEEPVSASLRLFGEAARFALYLASAQSVAPATGDGLARWRALLARPEDREHFARLAMSMPTATRCVPLNARGAFKLAAPERVLREFLDSCIDHIYRRSAYPGTGMRGWIVPFAHALRGPEPQFRLKDARNHGVPRKLDSWLKSGEVAGDRLAMELEVPTGKSNRFRLRLWLEGGERRARLSLNKAWKSGESCTTQGHTFEHPAHTVIRELGRAVRLFPELKVALNKAKPTEPFWTPKVAWRFLKDGVPALRDAGFRVVISDAFEAAGDRRIRAQMRITVREDASARLADLLQYRWEVVLGDRILSGDEFDELRQQRQPIVLHRGEWVLLDPAELKRLPGGIGSEGTLTAAQALRAVLTGSFQGVPVVADDRFQMILDAIRNPPTPPVPKTLDATLRPYQERGFAWLHTMGELGIGSCLADDMGLGKTIQVITHLLNRKEAGATEPTLVVCPTSVLGNWGFELERFAPSLSFSRYHGNARNLKRARRSDIVLTTYGLLVRDADLLSKVQWDVVALDEAQAIKNPDSRRAHAARSLQALHRVALSGTPVENRLEELWSVMEFLIPGLLGPRSQFRKTVAIPIERFGDEDVAESLKRGVAPFLLRRLKSDPNIIQDLPEKIEQPQMCALSDEQRSLYQQVSQDALDRIKSATKSERRGQILAMLTALKQVCNHPSHYLKDSGPLVGRSGKLDILQNIMGSILDNGERAIVFTQYREMGTRLQAYFLDEFGVQAPFLHGGVTAGNRDEMVRSFQEDEDGSPILIVSLKAGGTGLNLTRANHVIHYDRWWNPAVEDQATDRAYRIGQRKNVVVHKLITRGTLEERIAQLLDDKRHLAHSVVATGDRLVTELDDTALAALISLSEDAA